MVIGTLMWGFLYSPNTGPLTAVTGIDFLSNNMVLASLGNIVTWQWAGYNMIVLYAALQGMPREIYEAAKIDGASEVQIALRVKTPMISAALVLVTIFTIIGTLQFFTEPLMLQPLNPGAITNQLHAEHLRVQPGVLVPAVQLLGGDLVPARRGGLRRRPTSSCT